MAAPWALNSLLEWLGSEETIDINPFVAGVLTLELSFIYGAYMTETFRGAIPSIPWADRGRLGFRHGARADFVRITAPLMVRYALPGFTNNWLVLIKATALVSLIGLHDMTYAAKQASAARARPSRSSCSAAIFLVYIGFLMGLARSTGLL